MKQHFALKQRSIVFLRAVIVLIGVCVLALLLWEPHIEGRNVNATPYEIYFKDPFLAYAYMASIPFFVALYQAFKLLGYVGRGELFSQYSLQAVRTIKRCGRVLIGLVALGLFWIMLNDSDDRAGGVFIGVVIAVVFIVVTATATVLERFLKNAHVLNRKPHSFPLSLEHQSGNV